ncbi:hypothetical protein ACOMHN_055599 [Nucella lapillus]
MPDTDYPHRNIEAIRAYPHRGTKVYVLFLPLASLCAAILIAGSSLIARLASFMQRKKLSWNLPLPVRLLGKPGLQLSQLRASLDEAINQTPPAYLVLHTGTNDIGRLNLKEWILELTTGVLYIRARWPNTHVIWSDMLPRLAWKYNMAQPGAENARKRNQRRARALAYQESGSVIHHPHILPNYDCLLQDGVYLSDLGQDIFHSDLVEGLLGIVGDIHN